MSTCYKCGKELPDNQVECEPGCGTGYETVHAPDRDVLANTVEFDWSKVQTTEDLVHVMKTVWDGMRIRIGSPQYHALKKFLKE